MGLSLPHHGAVWAVCFSSDGKSVLTGSVDGTARLWEAGTSEPVQSTVSLSAGVWSLAFRADGKQVVTGGRDGGARIWDVSAIPKGNILNVACALLPDRKLDNLGSNYSFPKEKPICTAEAPGPDPAPIDAAK